MPINLGSVDVIMPTWNSNKPYFEQCLKSIKREIPVHHLIVVDHYSQDNTLEIVKKHFGSVILHSSRENLARARMIGINHVDTDYFVFVDSDVELPPNWFKRVASYVDANVGACHDQGYVPSLTAIGKWFEWQAHDRKLVVDVTQKNMASYRGCTHSTIVKTNAVNDWKPSSSLSAMEDWMLLRHVVAKGFVWRIINAYTVRHYAAKNMREAIKKTRWTFAGARVTGFEKISLRRLPAHLLLVGIQAFWVSVAMKEPRILPFVLWWRLAGISAYIGWNKYIVLQRK